MWPTAVLLGDSQTQLGWQGNGWVQVLAEEFVRRIDIVNRGFSGYNSRMLLAVLPDILTQDILKRADVVCIFLGSNDASMKETNPEQAVPVEEFGDNLLKIISYLLSNGVPKEAFIIISPPPVLPDKWTNTLNLRPGPKLPNCKSNDLTKAYASECGEVAKRLNVTFVDLFTHMMDPANKINLSCALSDGLHLGADGHNILFSLLSPIFKGKLSGKSGRMMFPEWKELTNTDVPESYKNWKITSADRV